MLRETTKGYKVGPLFADDEKIAEALYQACLNAAIGQPVFIDVPKINQPGINLVKQYQTEYVMECGRMYHGDPPQMALEKVFGVTTFELG